MRNLSLASVFLRLVSIVTIVSAATGGARVFADDSLKSRLAAVTQLPRFKTAHWGLLFMNLASGEIAYQENADKLFAPASTTKLYSVACALDALGADYRFETPVRRRGNVNEEGVLEGDLILVASGDPSMGGRTLADGQVAFVNNDHTYANGSAETQLTSPNPLQGLDALSKQIAAAGIKRVRGNVLIDDRLFSKIESTGSGPTAVTPIAINDNLIDFEIEPTTAGHPTKVTWRPPTSAFQIKVHCNTVSKGKTWELKILDKGQGRLEIHGEIPVGHKPVVRVHEVPNSADFARTLLIESLERAGVVVDTSKTAHNLRQELPTHDAAAKLPVVAKLVSPPFSQSARVILKSSHNLHASSLPMLVAVQHKKSTLSDGLHLQREFLAKAGLDVHSISFGGGAGGARADFVTPRATVQLLRHMSTRRDFPDYYRALPAMGVDGTLAKTVDANSPIRDKVHAKTGTLTSTNVMNGGSLLTSKALAGYMDTAKGKTLVFAIFVNNVHLNSEVTISSLGQDLGKICEIVYKHH